jgi:siroheme synthase-like protein
MSRYFPAYIDLYEKPCAVVGGGALALEKVESLLRCRARVTVIASEVHPGIAEHQAAGRVVVVQRDYRPGDLKGYFLVVAASEDRGLNARVAGEARERGALVNAVDDPPNCDFIYPSVVRRGDLIISISTSGRSPAMAKFMRRHLEQVIGPEFEALLELLAGVREELRATERQVTPEQWQEAIDDDLIDLVRRGATLRARQLLLARLIGTSSSARHKE